MQNFYNQNPKTKINLIFSEYKLLKTEFNNQQKIINELFQQISNFHIKKKKEIERELREKEMVDAFMQSDQAIYYTYVPAGIAGLLFIILIWRINASRNKITHLTSKIKDLEKNANNSKNKQQQLTPKENKKTHQNKDEKTSVSNKSVIEEKQIQVKQVIEEAPLEPLNNLIDDDDFVREYNNALSDINNLKSFIEKYKIKGLDRFSSQRLEEGVELELTKKIIEKSLFWIMKHPQTSELLILPGRDLWSRSRVLLSDSSRFGYLNFNGIFDITEGEEFKLLNFAIAEITEGKKYKITIKGELILPKTS